MYLHLLGGGYPVTVRTDARRAPYIEALLHAQSHDDEVREFLLLVAQACSEAFDHYLRVIATAGEIQRKALTLYRVIAGK